MSETATKTMYSMIGVGDATPDDIIEAIFEDVPSFDTPEELPDTRSELGKQKDMVTMKITITVEYGDIIPAGDIEPKEHTNL